MRLQGDIGWTEISLSLYMEEYWRKDEKSRFFVILIIRNLIIGNNYKLYLNMCSVLCNL